MTQTIKITACSSRLIPNGAAVHTIESGKLKYGFFEKKQDGSFTKAYEQFKKFEFGAGVTVDAEVEEKQDSFTGKDGKTHPVTRRKILYFKTDEHGTPYQGNAAPTQQNPVPPKVQPISPKVNDITPILQRLLEGQARIEEKLNNLVVEDLSNELPTHGDEPEKEELPF